jgi:hypothetical protein
LRRKENIAKKLTIPFQLYLLLSVICFAMPALSSTYKQYFYIHILAYSVPLAQIALYGSCYSTVALTIER